MRTGSETVDRPPPAATSQGPMSPGRDLQASLCALVAHTEKREPGQGGASGKRNLNDLVFLRPSLLPALGELLGGGPSVLRVPPTCPPGFPLPSCLGLPPGGTGPSGSSPQECFWGAMPTAPGRLEHMKSCLSRGR